MATQESRPRRRATVTILVVVLAAGAAASLALFARSDGPSGPYTVEQLESASVDENWDAPDDWLVVPGANPSVKMVSGIPSYAVGYEVQASIDGGRTWRQYKDESWFEADDGLKRVEVDESWVSDEDYLFRIRWVATGPKVSPWSETRIVKSASSVPTTCVAAMRSAAEVPASEDNNPELRRALETCETMEQWLTALYLVPAARDYDLNNLDSIDPAWEVDLICGGGELRDTRVCSNPGLGIYGDY